MAIEVINAVLESKAENPSKKWVLLGLANHSGPDGRNCYPSVRRLMVYGGLSESTVRAKLGELRDDGLIRVVRKASRYRPTEYMIDVDRLVEMRDPILDELSGKTPRSGTENVELSNGTPISGGLKDRGPGNGGLDDQGSISRIPGVQELESRGPGDGPEPYFKPLINPSDLNISLKQDPYIAAKIGILNQVTGGKPHILPPTWDLYDHTFAASVEDGTGVVICVGEDPDYQKLYLRDRATLFRNHWFGVDLVEFITESEWKKTKTD